ncbi:MAG: AMP-binding protein [Arcicella sp.]|nr:AMP-binding protein [Arcicella sp.]
MNYQEKYIHSITQKEAFWKEQADEIAWFKKSEAILSQDENGLYQWYKGSKLNTAYLALDHHVKTGKGDKIAIIYDSPATNYQQKYTYSQLRDEVAKLAGGLQKKGIARGDTVVIYMPMIPQAVMAMLACARLGTVHSVVFGGFAPNELAIRIDDAQPKAIISASCGIEFDKVIPYKPLIDAAIELANHKPDFCVIFQRPQAIATMIEGRDLDFLELQTNAQPAECVEVDATDPLYILYTSGTTGKPKGIVRDNGGHAVAMNYSIFFTAPTAFRAIRKEDPEALLMKKYDLSSLKSIFVAGERCDPSTLKWLQEISQLPVIDHWWQTESGWGIVANMMGLEYFPVKEGSATKPVCGFEIKILDEAGQQLGANQEGYVCVKLPLPPGCLKTLWKDDFQFQASYLNTFEGYYLSGDGGYIDEDGYVYIMGRIDDVINVAGHRLSTGAMEEILASHSAVAECAVVGIADELKGQRPVGFVVLKDGQTIDEKTLESETITLIKQKIGSFSSYNSTILVKRLPKTRSGKILRKIIRQIADRTPFTIPSTIDDPLILTEIEGFLRARNI